MKPERNNGPSWHTFDADEVARRLETDAARGLNSATALERLDACGPNELIDEGGRSVWKILRDQLAATMVVVLIVAALISLALRDYKDALAILAIVILNAAFGFLQEYRAEKAMAALKRLAVPLVRVRRDAHVIEISSRELVPGDVVLLDAGNFVPADARLIETAQLQVQEAALTGESEPAPKTVAPFADASLPVADRRNCVYMGTVVTAGRGVAIVTATGMDTELGAIAEMIQKVEAEQTPLQRRLDQLGRSLAVAALALVAVIFLLGLLRGEEMKLMFLTAVSMVVAVVPEGLPAVVTIALALGAQRMLKRKALIRKLPAAETLGSVTAICSDKTGTLTQNRMTVTALEVNGRPLDLTSPGSARAPADDAEFALLLTAGALCNDAHLQTAASAAEPLVAVGESTEAALLVAAAQAGLRKSDLEHLLPRVAELPFDSDRKRMSTVHRMPASLVDAPAPLRRALSLPGLATDAPCAVWTKGAADSLLHVCDRVWHDGAVQPLDATARARIEASADRLAQSGKRVLGVAVRPLDGAPAAPTVASLEHSLIFLGLLGLHDPARAEARAAVQTCKAAGIRALLITGDHPLTARHIAREVGIAHHERVLTGPELAQMPPEELERLVEQVSIYARVLPEHKFHIVQALQRRGHIVAMTGDGVNDAPALKRADIGVAMGITGTDVSKEASDMVLLDDNFSTIVAAVEEGRAIYDNIRKFIRYVLGGNVGEIVVMLIAPFFGMPLVLLPLQILWINLISDGICGLAMSVEPPERDTMRRAPYPSTENIFGQGMAWHILWVGAIMGAVPFLLGWACWIQEHPAWQTMVFGALAFGQIFHTLAVRSWRESLFRQGLTSNPAMLAAVAVTIALTLAVIYTPFLQNIFATTALTAEELGLTLLASTAVFWAIELEKWFKRRRHAEKPDTAPDDPFPRAAVRNA
ncbi:MAG: cation-translocating P-type ATPase [Verrucomicrobiota bacterium]